MSAAVCARARHALQCNTLRRIHAGTLMRLRWHVYSDAPVKAQLRANTEQAIAASVFGVFGVFGVPTLQIGEALLWGNDANPLMQALLADPQRLQRGEMALPVAVQRNG
ncbi:hypothetical protein [Xanthomonas translucens]|uniref:hypothetical protein n=1 Tax=Xanthomonas campestris pv. translucens TaxID=343 RepID=UPI001F48F730|nr:hypothetical protein [Xanthomonas translucens]